MIKTKSFSHCAVRIGDDVDKSKAFYEKVLGFKPLPRPNFPFGGAWYGVGDNQVHLISSQKREGIDPMGPHLAIEVEDFDATKSFLQEQGIEFLEAPSNVAGRHASASRFLVQLKLTR